MPVVIAPLPVVCNDKVLAPMSQVEAAAPVKFKAPTLVRARMPEVAVDIVRLPDVLVQAEVPPEAKVSVPVELPIVVVAVPVEFIFVVPVSVSPPVPCSKPVPELTPTAVTAPAPVTLKLVPVMAWAPMARALVMLAPEASRAVVMPPAALVTLRPLASASVMSLLVTSTSWAGGVALEPSVNEKVVEPVAAAAVATVKFWKLLSVKAILLPVVEMVLPLA